MATIRYILVSVIGIGAIGLSVFLGHNYLAQAFSPLLVNSNDGAVRDGAKVTVQFQITPQDNPTMTYRDTEQFIQGQHIIPPGLEQRMAGMHPGDSKTFPLSAEEGFGPYDETKIQIISTGDLPLEAREGDTVNDDAGRTAIILMILPEKSVLDLNHPLAGKPLIVTLQIVSIENPDEAGPGPYTIPGDDHSEEASLVLPARNLHLLHVGRGSEASDASDGAETT